MSEYVGRHRAPAIAGQVAVAGSVYGLDVAIDGRSLAVPVRDVVAYRERGDDAYHVQLSLHARRLAVAPDVADEIAVFDEHTDEVSACRD